MILFEQLQFMLYLRHMCSSSKKLRKVFNLNETVVVDCDYEMSPNLRKTKFKVTY